MFPIVAEELFSQDLLVVDSASAVFGKRQSSDAAQTFASELQSQWCDLELIHIMVGYLNITKQKSDWLQVPAT